MGIGLIFPGQGSQWVGMGKEFFDSFSPSREIFEKADEALGEPLSTICFQGPEDTLAQTIYTQPAILACSVAIWRALESELNLQPAVAAGHSLGEYSALVAAGALDFADAVRLVRARAECMQQPDGSGNGDDTGMLVIIGIQENVIHQICELATSEVPGSAVIANYNCPGQMVVGGHSRALEAVAEKAKAAGARRALRLPISVASHTPLMRHASERFREYLNHVSISVPAFPVVGSASNTLLREPKKIREELAEQLVRPVNWPDMVRMMSECGASELWEVGPRPILAGLCKRIEGSPQVKTVTTMQELVEITREAKRR